MQTEKKIMEGMVCHAGDVMDVAWHNLESEEPNLSQIRMSYRPTTLMFMNVVNHEFKVTFSKIWIFAIIVVKKDGSWGKLTEYIEAASEEWAKELAYLKAIDFFKEVLKESK